MKKQFLFFGILFCATGICTIQAQATQYNGSWALCKVVTPQGDTQKISTNDARYITYDFTYNNTFTSFSKKNNEECTGRWGYEFKTKTIKIKKPVLSLSKKPLNDYDLVIENAAPAFFVETRTENKKETWRYIYCRTK
ncbi:MAG: hypothetical protein JST67_05245 [Bacteroidetes bacterium]|nr:hypothetical protein [Bacteroidota bacterium]